MRKTTYAALLLAAALFAGGCKDDNLIEGGVHIPAINQATLTPTTDASGTRRAYIGTEISVGGFNLDQITAVTIGDVAAEVTEQTIKSLKFKVPALEFAQQDQPYEVRIAAFGADASKAIFTTPYYVSVPVTDARIESYSPAEGTVGTEITLTGRNLEQITRVHFGETVVEASAFSEVQEGATGSYVKFPVPAGNYTAADTEVAIMAEWGTAEIDVTGEAPFTLHVPVLDPLAPQAEGANSLLGDELDLTGQNLDLIDRILWGDTELTIAEQSATAIRFRFPATIEKADPAVQTRALTAGWGTPVQMVTLSTGWRLDTTPSATVLVPELTSMTAEDGGADNKFYLGKTITVEGKNLTAVEGIELRYSDGAEYRFAATILDGASDMQLEFTVPDQMAFTEATQMSVVAIYNGGDAADFGRVTVYPFYYFKGIRLGIGSNSKSTYTEYAAENAFFYPDLNRTVSTAAWYDEQLDPYARSGSNAAIASASKLDKTAITAEEYYAVKPYVFFITNSSSKLSLAGCANSASQIKTHCRFIDGEATSLPSAFGTPIIQYRVVTGAAADPIRNGTLTSMDYDGSSMPSAGAPSLANAETTSAWVKGSVLVMSYSNYARGDKPAAVTDFAKTGYIVIREITCADLETGLANADRAGYIEFDMYWSKMQNE